MSEEEIIRHMINFVEQQEHQVAINKLASPTQNKGDVVKAILDELEKVTSNENN